MPDLIFLTGRIVKYLDKEALERVIVETNPGFGVLTSAFLNAGATDVRVLENQTNWKSKFEVKSHVNYSGTKQFAKLKYRYVFIS